MCDAQQLASSYAYCRRIARTAARNFYYGFLLLPTAKRNALCSIYAFMRQADDISDSLGPPIGKQGSLAAWRAKLDQALIGQYNGSPILPAFHHTVMHYGIPTRYLYDLISGVEMDLSVTSYDTFDRLRNYCYRVAGTVGLSCLYVFGFRDPRAPGLAEKLGIAFQLTNILRDIADDMAMGRVYLPQEDLERFGCSKEGLASRRVTAEFVELMRFEVERAWTFYEEGAGLLPLVSANSRSALWALMRIYSGILAKIEERRYDVLSFPHAGLADTEKLWIVIRGRLGLWTPGLCPRKM
ncbi:MAG: phytoene/squalene synthase family protein [Acidobacteria bacterium]|nr:phytoene/squalene synthase family protein [Acidobacteriota bacterium]